MDAYENDERTGKSFLPLVIAVGIAIFMALTVVIPWIRDFDSHEPHTMEAIIANAPSLDRPVYDGTGSLTEQDIDALSDACANVDDGVSPQLAICYLWELPEGRDVRSAGLEIARGWGIGTENGKNGVLLLVAVDSHDVGIEVADDASTMLTDSVVGRILDDYALPKFKDDDYVGGMRDTMGACRAVLVGKSISPPTNVNGENDAHAWIVLAVISAAIILLIIFGKPDNGYHDDDDYWRGSRHRTMRSSGFGSTGSSSRSFGGGRGFSGGGSSRSW